MLLTPSFTFPGGELNINADVKAGAISVALCDANGTAIPGYENSQPLTGDFLKGTVTWGKRIPLNLRGRRIRIRFFVRNADLYSYWWE